MVQMFKPYETKPVEDLYIVPPYGYLDLRQAYSTGSVSSTFEDVEGSYNGISDPGSILGKPDDVFSAMRAAKAAASIKPALQVTSPEGKNE